MKSLVPKHLLILSILVATATLEARVSKKPDPELRKIEGISVEVLDFQEGEAALQSEVAANTNRPNHVTLVSSTEDGLVGGLSNGSESFKQMAISPKTVYFDFPFNEVSGRLSRHAQNQYNFYRTDRAAVVLLTVLTANTSVNWFIFSPEMYSDSAGIIVGINAFLYAYLGVNAPNWAQILRSSRVVLQKSAKFRNLNSKLQDFLSILTTNTAYNLSYYGLIQGVLNWNSLESLVGGDVIGLILKNTAATVVASGMWDLVLNEWQEGGRISESTRKKLSWSRSVIMVTLGNLMALGLPYASEGMLVFGAAGLSIYLTEINKNRVGTLLARVKSIKNMISEPREQKFLKIPFKFKSSKFKPSSISAGYCKAFL